MSRRRLPARITTDYLKRIGACEDDIARFETVFPRGVGRVTVTHVLAAVAARLDVEWLLQKLGLPHETGPSGCLVCRGIGKRNAGEAAAFLRSVQRRSTLREGSK